MDILIKGMEMPKGFTDVRIYADGRVVSRTLLSFGEEIATAVPVPPHGDLIDRDALKDLYHYNTHDSDIDKAWTCNIRRSIDNAPTVIKASE